jgi:23S rRNA (adenine2503-C2)-methyltransferase
MAPGLMPAVSTIAPAGSEPFFEKLYLVKERYYRGSFQLQFSVHSTNEAARDRLMPARKWSLQEIARYGEFFCRGGDRKVTLNFALSAGAELDPAVMRELFDPEKFLVKLTPVNPTGNAGRNGIRSLIRGDDCAGGLIGRLREAGFEVILSIGELEENAIGSNCGQFIGNAESGAGESYSYMVESR